MDFLQSFAHPEEMMALLRFKFEGCELLMSKCDFNNMSPSLRECYDLLNKITRNFAVGIQVLEGELRDAVCILYLVLRALDTVEDDMTIPNNVKVPMLKNFYKNLEDPDWRYMESKDKDRIVLESFPVISKEFRGLADIYKKVITEICQKMGEGMIVYLERKVNTMEEWDELLMAKCDIDKTELRRTFFNQLLCNCFVSKGITCPLSGSDNFSVDV